MYILGISAFYHDSAAALIHNGKIVAAAQEERFTRKKHDSNFPKNAIEFCLKYAGINLNEVQDIVFYDKPLVKFERLLETYLAYAPRGITSFIHSMPIWLKEKLFLKSILRKELSAIANTNTSKLSPLSFTEHHHAHAASAFFPSPFSKAAVLCLDGVGEWATTSLWIGEDNHLTPVWELRFPHSLGLLYSAFTYYTGFKVNSGEYKLMGLAPYGQPVYEQTIYDHLIDLKDDGSFRLNMEYFNYSVGLTMTSNKFHQLFQAPPRKPEDPITQKDMDLAASIQKVCENVVLRLCNAIYKESNMDSLCLAGGVALNCVANGRVIRETSFKNIWVQPAAGDAGGALGCALAMWHQGHAKPRLPISSSLDAMQGAYLGTEEKQEDCESYYRTVGANYQVLNDQELFDTVAQLLASGAVVGWCQGRMEFGPRALGNRSILADPRNPKMQTELNVKIKFRESFRPFAPSILAEDVEHYFEHLSPSPYMLIVAPLKEKYRLQLQENETLFGIDKLKAVRSSFPAITHVDYSARIQTVHPETNAKYAALLNAFKRHTGCPILVNTSFNVRGEPIVRTAQDAFQCFMRTNMDYLVTENCLLDKKMQPRTLVQQYQNQNWKEEFALD